MICCMVCENDGVCPTWKATKINVRNWYEGVVPINLIKIRVDQIATGKTIAEKCEKFKKMIFFV